MISGKQDGHFGDQRDGIDRPMVSENEGLGIHLGQVWLIFNYWIIFQPLALNSDSRSLNFSSGSRVRYSWSGEPKNLGKVIFCEIIS